MSAERAEAELTQLREAVKRATRGHNVRGSDGPCECELCLLTQENPDD